MSNNFISDGNKFKQVRQFLHLTQGEFAEMLGIGQPYYSAIETGRKQASCQVMDKLFSLGVSAPWYFNGIGSIIVDDLETPTRCDLIDNHSEALKKYYSGSELQPFNYEYIKIRHYEQYNIKGIANITELAISDLERLYNSYVKLVEIIHYFNGPEFLTEKFKRPRSFVEQLKELDAEYEEELSEIGLVDAKLKSILYLLRIENEKEHWERCIERLADYMNIYKDLIKEYVITNN